MIEKWQQIIKDEQGIFLEKKEKPECVCICCHRMLYQKSVKMFKTQKYDWTNSVVKKAFQSTDDIEHKYICDTSS